MAKAAIIIGEEEIASGNLQFKNLATGEQTALSLDEIVEKAWDLRKDLGSIPANLAIVYHYLGEEEKKQLYYKEAKDLGYHSMEAVDQIFDGSLSVE